MARLRQFLEVYKLRILQLAPSVGTELLDKAATAALADLPTPRFGKLSLDQMELQLVFRHDCL